MNVLDVLIVVLAVAAAVGGFRLGFLARASSWLGMTLGLLAAARLAPSLADRLGRSDAASLLFAAAGVLLVGALLGQLVGLVAGSRLRLAIPGRHGQRVDQVFGAGVGVCGVILAVWLLLPVLTTINEWPARQADGSSIASFVSKELPEPPDTLQGLAGLIGRQRWNQLLTDLQQGVQVAEPPGDAGIEPGLQESAKASVLRVAGEACDEIVQGTGFVVQIDPPDSSTAAPTNLVVTSAHVVAGVSRPTVGGRAAEIVTFDAVADLAVLRVSGPELVPLPRATAERGGVGGVFGYPDGTEAVEVSPYLIAEEQVVEVPNLYDSSTEKRSVFFLASDLHGGDSGGPLLDPSGNVVGVAFAIAPDKPGLAFASTMSELNKVLAVTRMALADDPAHTEESGGCIQRAAEETAGGPLGDSSGGEGKSSGGEGKSSGGVRTSAGSSG